MPKARQCIYKKLKKKLYDHLGINQENKLKNYIIITNPYHAETYTKLLKGAIFKAIIKAGSQLPP